LAEFASELDGVSSRLEKEHPDTNCRRRFMAWTLQRYTTDDLVPVYSALLLGSAFFVLLIAAGNHADAAAGPDGETNIARSGDSPGTGRRGRASSTCRRGGL
jgi:hypothetical protein